MAEETGRTALPTDRNGSLPAGATALPEAVPAFYLPDFLAPEESKSLFDEIRAGYNIEPRTMTMADGSEWQQTTGKLMFVAPRLTDETLFPASHGRRVVWPASIEKIMQRAAAITGGTFEVCVAIYYLDGQAGVDFHADLPAFGDTSSIASVSLGAERVLTLRDQRDPSRQIPIKLAPGSLLHMGRGFQSRYEHALLPDPHCEEPRINLTFRIFGSDIAPDRAAG